MSERLKNPFAGPSGIAVNVSVKEHAPLLDCPGWSVLPGHYVPSHPARRAHSHQAAWAFILALRGFEWALSQ